MKRLINKLRYKFRCAFARLTGVDKLELWSQRDQFINDQWEAAYNNRNIPEMERLLELSEKAFQDYKSTWK